ncbi:MAG: adenosine kinase [Deltaproteobacteria bacterium]|nr:adenosine kinase [Deltaproteobacteria bacterium]
MKWDVAGMGNALMDALAVVDDTTLIAELGLQRGVMQLVDHQRWMDIYNVVRKQRDPEFHSGGSCANTIAAIGWLGGRAIYHGQVGDDQMGHLYARLLSNACGGHALRFTKEAATGKCLALISAVDAERTMCTDLGAAVSLPDFQGFRDELASTTIGHFEGYALFGEHFRRAVVGAMEHVAAAGGKVSIDASDPSVIRAVPDTFLEILEKYASVCFLNEEEATRLTGRDDPRAALRDVTGMGSLEIVVVKLGARGSLVGAGREIFDIPVRPVHAVDTTGAGDAYAGGFLYGLTRGWHPARCGNLASGIAGLTCSQIGAVVQDRIRLAALVAEM